MSYSQTLAIDCKALVVHALEMAEEQAQHVGPSDERAALALAIINMQGAMEALDLLWMMAEHACGPREIFGQGTASPVNEDPPKPSKETVRTSKCDRCGDALAMLGRAADIVREAYGEGRTWRAIVAMHTAAKLGHDKDP